MNQTNKEIENSQKDIKSGYLGEEGDDVLVYTTNQTNNGIREEFNNKFVSFQPDGTQGWGAGLYLNDKVMPCEILDWWLSKLDSLLKTQREEMIANNDIVPKDHELTRSLTKGIDLGRQEVLKELLMEQHENELEGNGYDFYFSIRTKLDNLIKEQ